MNEYRHALEKIPWVHEPAIFGLTVHPAQVYAMLGRKQEAAAEPEKLQAVYPILDADARGGPKAWN